VTDNAACLEDLTRWLGVGIAMVGALVANPEATRHAWGSSWATVGRAIARVRGALARLLPWVKPKHARALPPSVSGSAVVKLAASARAITGWGPDATTEEKIAVLDQRTRSIDKELGQLQQTLKKAEETLRAELAESVRELRREAEGIRGGLQALKSEGVKRDAWALPIIVVGVVLTGLAADAEHFQLWFWSLLLLLAVAVTVWRIVAIVEPRRRDPRP
jgi:hypothetical protein